MAITTGLSRPVAPLQAATTPTIYNISVVAANTEYSQLLSNNTKQFTIKVRGSATLQIAFNATESGTNFLTIPSGSTYTSEGVNFSGTIYFRSSKAAQVVEIVEWV